MRMSKRVLMKTSHELAKLIVEDTQNYSIALSMAMKYVWRSAKLYNKARFGAVALYNAAAKLTETKADRDALDFVYGVPTWIINKNLTGDEQWAALHVCDGLSVVRETEKAELVAFDTDYGFIEMWCPKSVMQAA